MVAYLPCGRFEILADWVNEQDGMRKGEEVVKSRISRPKRKEMTAEEMEQRLKTVDEWRKKRLAEIRAQKAAS